MRKTRPQRHGSCTEVYDLLLTRRRFGLRVEVARHYDTGEINMRLMKGKLRKGQARVFASCHLTSANESQIHDAVTDLCQQGRTLLRKLA